MKKTVFFLSILLLSSCGSESNKLSNFQKLEGTWVSEDPAGKFVESWKTANDTLMEGTSYMILKGDTVFSEDLKLTYQNDSIHYIPIASGENEGKAVRFTLTDQQQTQWVFENKKHDFPQQIIYKFKDKDSLIATVQGNDRGSFRKLTFRLKRSN
jgi:hypothetical protein